MQLPGDDTKTVEIDGQTIQVNGTGNVEECRTILETLVYHDDDGTCFVTPCAIAGFYQPKLPQDKTFYALSAFR